MSAPTYFGSAAVPVDGASATNATATITITPPASMLAGDLVVVTCMSRTSGTWSVGVAGGQTWISETAFQGSAGPFCRIFWCTFNGTWGANPRFDCTVSACTSAIMNVFRPDSTAKIWSTDAAQATTQYTAPLTPFTVTRTGLTTVHPDVVSLASFFSLDDNTWGSMTGTGWVLTGSAQYRNTSGTQDSCTFAHHLDAATGTVVPSVSKNQATLGGDAGVTAIISWFAYDPTDLTSNLVAYYKLDETSGTRNDSVGSSNLTDNNTVLSAAGKINNAADFELDNSEFLSCADNAALSTGDIDYTLQAWVRLESKSSVDMGILSRREADADASSEYVLMWQQSLDRFVFYIRGGNNWNGVTANTFGAPSLATWYLIHCWHDAVNNLIGIAINAGTPDTQSYSTGSTDTGVTFRIGAQQSPEAGFFDGLIDEAGIWKRMFTSANRTSLFNSGAGLAYPFTGAVTGKPWYYYNQQMAA